MKPVPAIVQGQHDQVLAAVRATYSALREVETQVEKIGKRLDDAKGAAEKRRLDLGRALVAAHALWPTAKAAQGGARGPGGRTWEQFLDAEGISKTTAWRYIELAGGPGSFQSDDEKRPVDNGPRTYADLGMDNRPRGGLRAVPDEPDFDPVSQPPAALPRPGFALRLGRYQDVLADVGMVDAVVVDPPFSKRTHDSRATRNDGVDPSGLAPDFEPWSEADVDAFVAHWSPRARGWLVCLCDDIMIPWYRAAYVKAGRVDFAPVPCVIRAMSVRTRADGPSSWAVYAMVSRPRGAEFANWGTLPGAYVGNREAGSENGRGKPLWLTDLIVGDYSRPGDLVSDPLAGYGGTLISALDAGRRCIGAELDHAAYDEAHRRAAQPRPTHEST